MKVLWWKIVTALYVSGFIVCFGLSYNLDYQAGDPRYRRTEGADNAIAAIYKAALWPLWVSVKLGEGLRKEAQQ